MEKLTIKQKRFTEEYMIDFNGAQAAIRSGYTPNSARIQANKLLNRQPIKLLIQQKQNELTLKTGITVEKVIEELRKHAFQDIKKLYDADGNLKSVTDMDNDCAASLISLEIEEMYSERNPIGNIKKIRRSDPLKALELLGKCLGMFAADNAQKKDQTIVVINK